MILIYIIVFHEKQYQQLLQNQYTISGTHRIRTIDEIPVAQPYRRIIKSLVGDITKQIDEWIEEGVIVKSSSEFVSPLVIVRKSSGDIRLCVDYRKLNKKPLKMRIQYRVLMIH